MKKSQKAFIVILEILLWPLFLQAIIYCVCELFRPVFNFFFTHMHDFYYDCIRISEYGMFYFYAFRFIWAVAFVSLFFFYLSRRAQIRKFRSFFTVFVLSAIPMILMRITMQYDWVIHPVFTSPYQDLLPFLTFLFRFLYVIIPLWSLANIIFSVRRMTSKSQPEAA